MKCFERMNFGVFVSLLFMVSCAVHEEKEASRNVVVVRNALGDEKNIFRAKAKLDQKGFNVSEPHDPTQLGKKLWMIVEFDDSYNFLDGVLYAAEVPHKTVSSSVLIESNGSGRITSIRYGVSPAKVGQPIWEESALSR